MLTVILRFNLSITITVPQPQTRLSPVEVHTLTASLGAPRAGLDLSVPPALAVERLSHRYNGLVALRDVSLAVAPGEILCVLGASGSGKSTLLRLVAGVDRPSAGRIALDGIEVAGPDCFIEPERRRVGMVFQDYALFPHLTVAANVGFGLKGVPRAEVDRRVRGLLDRVGLTRYASSHPHTLSGGERQRVALARALAARPRVLLMDEPFSSLDGPLRSQVRQHTLDLLRETLTTTVIVTHDPDEAMRIADRIAVLDAGRLAQCGSPEDLYRRPACACVARTFGDVNELRGTCVNGQIETPLGRFPAPHVHERASVSVFIRPQDLQLAPGASSLPARVVRTTFLGDAVHVVLDVPGLHSPIAVSVAGRRRLEPGDTVHIDVHHRDDVPVIAHDGSPPALT
jgi:iron(III) transport system ATP-binding protein